MSHVPSNPRTPSLAARLSVGMVLAVGLGLYVAGVVFLAMVGKPPGEATPLTILRYVYYFGSRADLAGPFALSGGAGALTAILCLGMALSTRPRPLHGEARFALAREVKAAGLYGEKGIVLGRHKGRYLILDGQQGVLLKAPPRSGKGVGVVIPTLLNWDGSVIVNDIKGENFDRTAGFRKTHGQRVHLFDPLSSKGETACWNVLDTVSNSPARRINELQRVSSAIYPDAEGDSDKSFWTSSARTMFLGIALYIFETPGMLRTLGEVLRQGMASDAEGFQSHWRKIVNARNTAGNPLSPQCQQALCEIIDLAPATASSIRKTFTSRLDLWMNPMVDAATSRSDFDLRQLRRERTSIYVRIDPDDVSRLQPLLSLFWQVAIGEQTRALPEHDATLKHQLLLVMDEFKSVGRLSVLADATAYLPGYNVRTLIVVQADSQLIEVYGPKGAESIRKMLAATVVFPPKEYEEAEALSKELGTYTVAQKATSRSIVASKGGRSSTVSTSDQPRRLLMAQEIKELGSGPIMVFYEGLRPVQAERILYFQDEHFASRETAPPEVPRIDVEAAQAAMAAAYSRDILNRAAESAAGGGEPHTPEAAGAWSTGEGGASKRPKRPRPKAAAAQGTELDAPVVIAHAPDSDESTTSKRVRPMHASDLTHIAKLQRADFDGYSLNFAALEALPEERPLSAAQVEAVIQNFLGAGTTQADDSSGFDAVEAALAQGTLQ